jgi:acetolactate decarboxylase
MKLGAPALMMLFLLLLSSCDKRKVVSVTRVGELEKLIMEGDLGAHAHLKDFENQPDIYAIGLVANNDGYITMIGGKPYTSRLDSSKNIVIDSSLNADATLLLYSRVKQWKPYEIPADVTTWKQFEQFITNMATKYDVAKNRSFPFMLDGNAAELSWHVLGWRPGIKEITYRKIHSLGQTGVLRDEKIQAIGFYSKDPKEIFVHQETVLNIHFVNHDHSLAGRIEDMKLDGRMILYFPELSE